MILERAARRRGRQDRHRRRGGERTPRLRRPAPARIRPALRDPDQKAEGEGCERNRKQALDHHSLNALRDPGTELRATNHADRKRNRPMDACAAREATGHDVRQGADCCHVREDEVGCCSGDVGRKPQKLSPAEGRG